MDDSTRESLLKAALVVFGVIFFLVYPPVWFGHRDGCGTEAKASTTYR